ncbi:hypothetical protein KAJ02_12705 [Candidatus Bipolaricaulota bacterium]|nr:hypothetical protein [Candidatus Bipolaricaulota bacterium]
MTRRLGVFLGLILVVLMVVGCLFQQPATPTSAMSSSVFDRQGLIERVQERCEPIEALLAETGDTLDYENLRFFTATKLNGADETVVSIFLTEDSPSSQAAMLTEEESPLEALAPLPFAVLLPLEPCTSFSILQNGVPYLYRILSYEQAELVDAEGKFVRYATEFSWEERGTSDPEPEWHKYIGNYIFHFLRCATISTNQN